MPLRTLVVLFGVAAVGAAAAAGYVAGRESAAQSPNVPAEKKPAVYLDDGYTYLGAVRSWPAKPKSRSKNPFPNFGDARLVELGRTVCIRAGDPGMDFDGMLFLLKLNPHQTFVVITEAIDKLCPSQRAHLEDLTS